MKNIAIPVLVSVISSIITVSIYQSIFGNQNNHAEVRYRDRVPAKFVGNINESPKNYPNITNVNEFTDAAFKSTPAVVHIKSPGKDKSNNELFDLGSMSSGSGVIVSVDGYIITNNHVIDGAKEVKVTLNDKRTYNAKVIGTDPTTDLAVIKIKEKELGSRKLQALEYGNSDIVEVGQWVLAVGNPFNLTSTVTAGIVSAKGRNIDILEGTYSVESFIQTDAVVNPGNSGGALIDTEGNLIGINTAIITRSGRYEGYSFAVPVNLARKVAKDLIEFGTVQRGFMGVTIKDITNQMFEDYNLSSMDGVYLDKVNSGGAAEESGLKKGDIITFVNEVRVKSSPELQEQVALFRPGQKVKVIYLRNGKEFEIEVKLKNASNGTDLDVQPIKSRFTNKETLLSEMGIEIRQLTDAEKRKLKTKRGLIVTSIRPGSIISKTNMEKGFIITSVNKTDIQSVEEFIDLVMDASGEVVLDGFYESYSGDYSYVFDK
jgi:Do/DeqQ family serine protease